MSGLGRERENKHKTKQTQRAETRSEHPIHKDPELRRLLLDERGHAFERAKE